jgi:hypothetical protein
MQNFNFPGCWLQNFDNSKEFKTVAWDFMNTVYKTINYRNKILGLMSSFPARVGAMVKAP